uniref:NADH-ubiquinone oxidoreductase chain 2 n=1 Tax=Carrhotus xanthogramma TaxID=1112393 RepID=A0A0H3W0Z2_CARXA|nr:NADH dehydrogenase subunit 2 [Carrhotus xanthogramma]AKH36465.1 NADH dehydrogenase subunit 2 [Carrhotus xanthogramma]
MLLFLQYIVLYVMYLVSFIIVMSSEDWFLIWLGLEVNMMSFLILVYRRDSMSSIECCMKYFFIQGLGSALLIGFFYMNKYGGVGIINMILSFKIGAGPFFYWFPSMCSGLTWVSCYVLMVLQKMLPLFLISLSIHWILWLVLMMSLVLGVVGSFNQSNIKQLLAYSSIHHLGWIMIIMMSGSVNWMLYLVMYSFMLLGIILVLVENEVVDLHMMYKCKGSMWFSIGMLSLAGMPPLLGFFLKWMALSYLTDMMYYIAMLIVASVIMLYVYMRLMYDIIMMGGVKSSWIEVDESMFTYNYDIVSMVGLLLGVMMGIMLIM